MKKGETIGGQCINEKTINLRRDHVAGIYCKYYGMGGEWHGTGNNSSIQYYVDWYGITVRHW